VEWPARGPAAQWGIAECSKSNPKFMVDVGAGSGNDIQYQGFNALLGPY
jgi:hypothetical protein